MTQPIQAPSAFDQQPLVSIVLATRNESRAIESCLVSILSQKTISQRLGRFDIEILAIDGMSDDGTRSLLQRYAANDSRLQVLSNEKLRTPFAFNLGLRRARGVYVCIFGAHTVYRDDYIATCLDELVTHNAAGCGGRVVTIPSDCTTSAQLAAWALSHPFGSSGKSFRTQTEGSVDTVNYPLLRRDLVLAAGGYDEELARNQDNDLNQKIRALGHTLWCTWKTECLYFPKSTLGALFRYAYTNGFWNVLSLRKNRASMAARHFIPLVFVLSLLVGITLAIVGAFLPGHYGYLALSPLATVLGAHLLAGLLASIQLVRRYRAPEAVWMPAVFLGFHTSYGYGTLCGLISHAWKSVHSSLRALHRAEPMTGVSQVPKSRPLNNIPHRSKAS
jgi:succinoglycan biosynthesis protein ExoA